MNDTTKDNNVVKSFKELPTSAPMAQTGSDPVCNSERQRATTQASSKKDETKVSPDNFK
jgi:hypothetical protein